MSANAGVDIVENGLVLFLDAGNRRSYPSTGTTWFNLADSKYNFTVAAAAWNAAAGNSPAFFNFEAVNIADASSDVPNFSNATVMVFTSILNSTGNWRTLMRGNSSDHQVIIENGSNRLGMYDNDAPGNFIYSGFDITSLPNPYTQFNCLTFRLANSSPYYQFQFNSNSTVYSITNPNATFNNGFRSVGGCAVCANSQGWGKIGAFLYYNRHLSQSEIAQNFNALRSRFGV